jgi:PncC family amidohydrolase
VLGGFVTYSNEAKMQFANVQAATLEQYGAVSEQTAREMVRGVRAAFGVDYAVSATGIVGPGGATATKPVGLVYIGLAGQGVEIVRQFHWNADREANKGHTADAALTMLLEVLEGERGS